MYFSCLSRIEKSMNKRTFRCLNFVPMLSPSCKLTLFVFESNYSLMIILMKTRKLTNLIKLREIRKTSLLECALAVFQARYAVRPPVVGGNRRVSFRELCVLSAFLFYTRPDVNRIWTMIQQQHDHHPACYPQIMLVLI
jgi:hypothetical protein